MVTRRPDGPAVAERAVASLPSCSMKNSGALEYKACRDRSFAGW